MPPLELGQTTTFALLDVRLPITNARSASQCANPRLDSLHNSVALSAISLANKCFLSPRILGFGLTLENQTYWIWKTRSVPQPVCTQNTEEEKGRGVRWSRSRRRRRKGWKRSVLFESCWMWPMKTLKTWNSLIESFAERRLTNGLLVYLKFFKFSLSVQSLPPSSLLASSCWHFKSATYILKRVEAEGLNSERGWILPANSLALFW